MREKRPVGQGVKSDRVPTLFKKTLEQMVSQQVQRCGVELRASVKCKPRRKAVVVNRGWRRSSKKARHQVDRATPTRQRNVREQLMLAKHNTTGHSATRVPLSGVANRPIYL